MTVALLDVNILLALMQGFHEFHSVADRWFRENRARGWATCTITEAGFVRIAAQSWATRPIPVQAGLDGIEAWCATPEHQFWPLDYPLSEILPEIRRGIHGPKQLTDAILLDLAIRRGGRLATFDRKLRQLLPEDSPLQDAIEIVPV